MPDVQPFTPVSPKLARVRLIVMTIVAVPMLVGAGGSAAFAPWWVAAILFGGCVIALGWGTWVVVRQVGHMGYQRREHDLLVQRGIMFRRTTLVPYGRMQFVEVSSGPIDRMFGLAKVELHTASAKSDADIPGLPRHDADELRDMLAALGETQLAGL